VIDWEAKVGAPVVGVFATATALYIPTNDALAPYDGVQGVFDEAYREVSLIDTDAPTSDARPVIGINDGQFKFPPVQDDRLVITTAKGLAGTYIVKEVRADAHGITKLMLNKTADYAP
jgi:hypothetical protein